MTPQERRERTAKLEQILVRLVIMPVGLFVAWLMFICIRPYFENNQVLRARTESFKTQVLHPAQTQVVATHAQVTRSPGNGNSCFYFVGQVRRHEGMSQVALLDFYQDQAVSLRFLRDGAFGGAIPHHLKRPEAWGLSSQQTAEKLYMVYTGQPNWDDLSDTFDLRCS